VLNGDKALEETENLSSRKKGMVMLKEREAMIMIEMTEQDLEVMEKEAIEEIVMRGVMITKGVMAMRGQDLVMMRGQDTVMMRGPDTVMMRGQDTVMMRV